MIISFSILFIKVLDFYPNVRRNVGINYIMGTTRVAKWIVVFSDALVILTG